jgi:hypothetical protein
MSRTKDHKTEGAQGFPSTYWQENYSEAENMDGIGNAQFHAAYMKNIFALELVDISTVIDFGFGLGHLFEEVMKAFIPYRAMGIEPSAHAYDLVKKRGIAPVASTKLTLKKMDLKSWCEEQNQKSRYWDLGLCTSVLQYLSDDEIDFVLPILAQKVKYLYLSVPTDKELLQQRQELEFHDRYAIARSRSKYLKLIKPHFTIVSSRLLESRVHFDQESSFFTDYLFRF